MITEKTDTQTKAQSVTVKIMGSTYKIKCAAEKLSELKASSEYLEDKIKELSNNSNVTSLDRVTTIAALNLANELLTQKRQNQRYIQTMQQRIQALQHKIEAALKE